MQSSVPPSRLLSRTALPQLRPGVSAPTYRATDLRAGVVHLGVGRFHRAHQASYFDRLAEDRVSWGWGIVGAGLRRRSVQHALAAHDHPFSRCEQGDDGVRLRVLGALKGFLFAPQQLDVLLQVLASPETKLVSMTITAAAY